MTKSMAFNCSMSIVNLDFGQYFGHQCRQVPSLSIRYGL